MNTKSINAENVLTVLCDSLHLFVIRRFKEFIQVQVLNNILSEISSFNLRYHYNPYIKGVVDNDLIYLPTLDGLILGLDKFTGERIVEMNTRSSIPISNLVQDINHIYVLSVIPVSTGEYIKTNSIVLDVYQKQTGNKKLKSSVMKGHESVNLGVDDHYVYVAVDKIYYRYQIDGQLIYSRKLSHITNYSPIISKECYWASKHGTLDVFSDNQVSKYYSAPNECPPLLHKNIIYWFTNQGLFQITTDDVHKIVPFQGKKILFSHSLHDILAGISESELCTYKPETGALFVETVDFQGLTNSCVLEGSIAVQTKNTIQLMEIN